MQAWSPFVQRALRLHPRMGRPRPSAGDGATVHSATQDRRWIWSPSVSNKRIRRYLNSHRPSVASECDGRNRGSWLPSRVGWCAALAYVSAAKSRSPRIGWPFRLLPWFVPQLPLHGPARDSNVCICGRSRSDRARCAPVVHWSEQSCLKNVPYQRHFGGGVRWVHFSFICSAPSWRC